MAANAVDFAGTLCGCRYEKELETHFRDCLLFYIDGRIRFERYCYGEAACLVFSLWANGLDETGKILWVKEPEFEVDQKAIPRVITDVQENGTALQVDNQRKRYVKTEEFDEDKPNGYGRFKVFLLRRKLKNTKPRGRSCAPFYSIHIYQQAELPPAYRAKRHIRGQFLLIRLFSDGVLRCHSLQIKSAPHPRWSRGHRSAAELPAFRHRWSGRQHTFLPLRQTGCHHPHTGCRSAPLP